MTSPIDHARSGARPPIAAEPLRPRGDLEAIGQEAHRAREIPAGLVEPPDGVAPYDASELRRALADRLSSCVPPPDGPAGCCPHCGGAL